MPSLQGPVRSQCGDLTDALPKEVVGQERRDVSPPDAPAVAWGDPAIVLTCGVARPTALRRTSYCLTVDSIGWLATQDGREVDMTAPVEGALTFTTIERSVYVQVRVPAAYVPAVDPLVDVAEAISSTTRRVHPCSS